MSRLLAVMILLPLLVACASIEENRRAGEFESAADRYARRIRFNEFEKAAAFLGPGEAGETGVPSLPLLRKVRVSDYEVLGRRTDPDGLGVRQTVEIRYYRTDELVERSIRDEQYWRYDTDRMKWFLETGLPAFTE